MRLVLTSLVCLALFAGCFRARVTTGKPASGVHLVQWSHTFIGGLIGDEQPAGCEPAVVETRLGILGFVASVITAGVWVPLTVDVECAAGAAPAP